MITLSVPPGTNCITSLRYVMEEKLLLLPKTALLHNPLTLELYKRTKHNRFECLMHEFEILWLEPHNYYLYIVMHTGTISFRLSRINDRRYRTVVEYIL